MRMVEVEWQGRRVAAAWPEPIATERVVLSEGSIRATARAEAAVSSGAAAAAGASEVAARLLLRAEGLSSSMIEGLRVSPTELAMAEADPAAATGTVAAVADNLAVVDAALATPGPLTVERLFEWHERLLRHAPTLEPGHVGIWRDTLGWVGGANPLVAAHVATPAPLIPSAMDDLIAFANRDDLDPISVAAVTHAQFETVHPFADGNGRLGRILIARTLAQRIGVPTPPPVSTQFARDIGGYLSGLALYRQGNVDAWVRWFADAVSAASAGTNATFDAVADLRAVWAARCEDLRRDSAARRLLEELGNHPVLNAQIAAELLGVTSRAARTAVAELGRRGVLLEVTGPRPRSGRPARWWAATELLALASA